MKKIIALDVDGVLLDFHQSYRLAWQRAFGELPELKDPLAYWPMERWNVERLEGNRIAQFRACFDQELWSSIPALPGALTACHQLDAAGYDLVCVTAVPQQFLQARIQNLLDAGFPVKSVVATSHESGTVSPKAQALKALNPVAFVDDYLPFLRGLPSEIHAALVLREPNGSPNVGEELSKAHSTHADLQDFANWWLHK